MTTQTWPFDSDAKQDDPLTELRIPVVTNFNPSWYYIAAYLGTNADNGSDWEPSWPFASADRPTDREAAQLASFIREYIEHWYNASFKTKLAQRPLDVDGGCNTTVFIKYGPDDWGYRRVSWIYGPTFVPGPPNLTDRKIGPLALQQVMDRIHAHGDEPSPRWQQWKSDHSDVFGGGSRG